MPTPKITKNMLHHLECDKNNTESKNKENLKDCWTTPTVMFVFSNSDLNAAAYHLFKSIEQVNTTNSIATVLVEEPVREAFIVKLQAQLRGSTDICANKNSQYTHALEVIKRLKVQTIENEKGPVLACDITHDQLSTEPTGIVTFHTFRTAKEAIALFGKESLNFINATIWNANHSCAYEIVVALKCNYFYINCFEISFSAIKGYIELKGNYVTIENNYHYETMFNDNIQKNVVFPIGTIFAN